MFKHLFSFALALILSAATLSAQQAKYVFFFLGDGMGFGAVTLTEDFLAMQNGRMPGNQNLTFSTLPVKGFMTTFSANNLTTCSAASATAFACGTKTNNGMLGQAPDGKPLKSIAARLHDNGYRVGITTSVSIDHATPAGYYAHQPKRSMYYEIARELPRSGFEFFSGAGFLYPNGRDGKQESVVDLAQASGYAVLRSLDECKASAAQKIILLRPESKKQDSYPYVIDKSGDDYTLAQTTALAIEKLMNPKGFFMLVEGGKIDWASHDNDAGAMVHEVVDMDNAVSVALAFYKKYPKQTLIVVTADHETGGLGVEYSDKSDLRKLALHKASVTMLGDVLSDTVSFARLKRWLADSMAYVPSFADEMALRKLFADGARTAPAGDNTACKIKDAGSLAQNITRMVSHAHGALYCTFGHTGTMVPVYAVGAGSDLFSGKIDNADIPKKIAKAAGVRWE